MPGWSLKLHDAEMLSAYDDFFATVTRLDVPNGAYRTAAQLRASYGLKTPDALHLAIAQYHECSQLWSNDDRLVRAVGTMAVNVIGQIEAAGK